MVGKIWTYEKAKRALADIRAYDSGKTFDPPPEWFSEIKTEFHSFRPNASFVMAIAKERIIEALEAEIEAMKDD